MAENVGYEDAALERIAGMLDPMSEAMAQTMGLPPGAKRYTEQEQLEEYNYSPIADPNQRLLAMMQLISLGKTDEEITDAVYPNRRRTITTGRPNIQDQIDYAKSVKRTMQKQAESQGMPMMPVESSQPQPASPEPMAMPEAAPALAPVAPAPAQPAAPSILDQPFNSLMGE